MYSTTEDIIKYVELEEEKLAGTKRLSGATLNG